MSWLYLLCVISVIQCAYSCNSFINVTVELGINKGTSYKKSVKGCISKKSVSTKNVVNRVLIVNQPIQRLSVGAVEDFDTLDYVEFSKCSIETVQPRAFRNLPNLQTSIVNYGLLTEIPKGIFVNAPSLNKVSFSHHNITKIAAGAFAIPSLQIVHVWYNKLTKWDPSWFTTYDTKTIDTDAFVKISNQSKTNCDQNCIADNLTEIDFRDNLFTELPSYSFRQLINLEKIVFDCNSISRIEPKAFSGLDKLKQLSLAYNRLKTIDLEWFPKGTRLSKLSVSANKLNFISFDVLKKIKPKQIVLDGNPWTCACHTNMTTWISENSLKILTTDGCHDEDVPICIDSEDGLCREVTDDVASERYFAAVQIAVKDVKTVIHKKCFRFD